MKNRQLKWLLGLTAAALLSTSITFGNRWTGATVEENDYGAIDPTVPESHGLPHPNLTPPVALDGAITANVLVNSRELCPNGRGLQQNETSLAVSGNTVVVAFNDARGASSACPDLHAAVGWAYSLDSGTSFTDGGGLPFSRNFNNGDPWLGVSPDGSTFYLSGLWNFYGGLAFYRGTLNPDGSFTWGDPVIINFGGGSMDKEAFVVDPASGAIYLTWTQLGNGIRMTKSIDGGNTWSTPVQVFSGGGSQGSMPAVDANGTLFVAYDLGWPPGTGIGVSRSTDGGASFQTLTSFPQRIVGTVPGLDRSTPFPQIAIDMTTGPRAGWIYVVYHSTPLPDNVTRPFIAHSEDGGDTWSTPAPINTDDGTDPHWWPSVSVDSRGNVNVIYLRRLSSDPLTRPTDTYFAQSTDGGVTFVETRLSDVTSNWSSVRFDGGFCYSCDYIRGISVGTKLNATWVDVRNGDPDIYFAVVDTAAMAAKNQKVPNL